ncbi:MAG: hypothetical protein LBP38_06905 [Desulfovibrio sp.]|jgi:hypothetical protein|nr:hypothetical protein [Desulfovibrio sp.]
MQEFLTIHGTGAAWFATAALFFLIRFLLRAPEIFTALAGAALSAALFALSFPALPEHWSFVVFGVLLFPIILLIKLFRSVKARGKKRV